MTKFQVYGRFGHSSVIVEGSGPPVSWLINDFVLVTQYISNCDIIEYEVLALFLNKEL